ncbi:DUF4350 domain-containing protein [Leptolyngbya sp. FACHB-321]|uniref:DUF4350 domain-containing protein n=1 Tax=Leptolyngbya sp. FACHB-321 TaxID=2692807 RepID=UPI0016856EAE|nr:DUF4350 domain-containing protein [Leptolyngbya sp. FACHB-321]MBD2038721.1 DUF4350 domain-containing protein [Leptolyngbya sp. FACHB-321]
MTLSKRQIWILAIALAALMIISLFAAPGGKQQQSGSTYGRSPDGYGAWYAFMESRGVTIQRWQKPLKLLFQPSELKTPTIETANPNQTAEMQRHRDAQISMSVTASPELLASPAASTSSPITLLQVSSGEPLSVASMAWVERGNVLILLGAQSPVTKAPFESAIGSPAGAVQIHTSRRETDRDTRIEPLLNDSFGAVVWQQTMGQGRVVFASTPHLTANAYQDAPGNFEFLATLVTATKLPIWVDEYSHGYKDAEVIKQEDGNLVSYLAKTPLLLVLIQVTVMMLVLLWGQNRRFGPAIALTTPIVDNSEAYIQAMSAVLRKAESNQFVVDTICKAEQLAIQKALGLGTEPLPLPTLLDAWTQQTGQPAAILEAALNSTNHPRRSSEAELSKLLEAMQTVRKQLAL